MIPSSKDVCEQLERILSSPTFSSAGRHSRLLRYLVERTLAGDGDQLKEYVLGTEVFDRAESYDPRIDSIVRVEARRLRSRLAEYYRGPGSGDAILIDIPRGSYAPTFSLRDVVSAIAQPSPQPSTVTRFHAAGMVAVAAALVLAVVVVGWLISGREPSAQASSGPSIAVLPFHHYSALESDALVAARLTDAVTTELARLRTLSVASRTTASQYTGGTRSVAEISKALNVEFVMEATAVTSGDATVATVRIVDAVRDRKVWVDEYAINPGELAPVARRIAFEAAEGTLKYHARNTPPR